MSTRRAEPAEVYGAFPAELFHSHPLMKKLLVPRHFHCATYTLRRPRDKEVQQFSKIQEINFVMRTRLVTELDSKMLTVTSAPLPFDLLVTISCSSTWRILAVACRPTACSRQSESNRKLGLTNVAVCATSSYDGGASYDSLGAEKGDLLYRGSGDAHDNRSHLPHSTLSLWLPYSSLGEVVVIAQASLIVFSRLRLFFSCLLASSGCMRPPTLLFFSSLGIASKGSRLSVMPDHDVEEAISMETNQIILALRFSCDTQAACDAFYSRLCNRKKTKNERTVNGQRLMTARLVRESERERMRRRRETEERRRGKEACFSKN
ncbi:hypothetical protein C0Q70_14996 [Pomacea canaliculata]|uniref:Uncharacterized protein n=1 Tax=Pomacea canaliculata TaxID=400727 RepID=A0A2T7NTN8_POMCA|nr:hypothetical protein C0Q70_14996 [Pomacea canaliculata]